MGSHERRDSIHPGRALGIAGGLTVAIAAVFLHSLDGMETTCDDTALCAPPPPITYSLPEVVAIAAIGLAGLGIAAVIVFVGWRRPLARVALVTAGVALCALVPLYWLPVSTFPANLLFLVGGIALAVGAIIELVGL